MDREEEIQFNVNSHVKIKLTQLGRDFLAEKGHPYEEDANGWSTWQLWAVMETFGPFLTPCWGEYCYFESVIKIIINEVSDLAVSP